MAEDQGLTSPPYPAQATTSKGLYRHLLILRQWVEDQQKVLREELKKLAEQENNRGNDKAAMAIMKGRDKLDPTANLPADTVWENVGVMDKYMTLMYVRHIREGFDYVLREHEDAWDGKLSIRKRLSLVLSAMHILDEAFVNPEVREMRTQKAAIEHGRRMHALEKHLKQIMVPEELRGDSGAAEADKNESSDAEDWFGGNDAPPPQEDFDDDSGLSP